MSKYTTEVRYICEQASGFGESRGYNDVDDIISHALPKVFNFSFPIFDEEYRDVLSAKILKHYYTREICTETVGLWKLRLSTKMNEIMPYYNQLYKSQLLEFNPLYDTDVTTTTKGTKDATRTDDLVEANTGSNISAMSGKDTVDSESHDETTLDSHTTNANENKDLYSDTPQGSLNRVVTEEYLTNARKVNNEGEEHVTGSPKNDNTSKATTNYDSKNTLTLNTNKANTGTQKNLTLDDYVVHVMGKTGGTSFSKMLQDFRSTFLNIDMMVIEELNDLFMTLW